MSSHETDIAFACECHTAGELLQHGLAALERAAPGSADDMFVPVLLLGAGCERLCKVVLWRAHQSFPTGSKGHDIQGLFKAVIAHGFTPGYLRFRAAKKDFEFLSRDRHVANFINLLTVFSADGRYHQLDKLLERTKDGIDPAYKAWRVWDEELNNSNSALVDLAWNTGGTEYRYAVTRLRMHFAERLFRAITRLLCPNVLPLRGETSNCDPLSRFAGLPDDALGKTDYIVRMKWYDPFRGFRTDGAFAYSAVQLRDYPECLE